MWFDQSYHLNTVIPHITGLTVDWHRRSIRSNVLTCRPRLVLNVVLLVHEKIYRIFPDHCHLTDFPACVPATVLSQSVHRTRIATTDIDRSSSVLSPGVNVALMLKPGLIITGRSSRDLHFLRSSGLIRVSLIRIFQVQSEM